LERYHVYSEREIHMYILSFSQDWILIERLSVNYNIYTK